MGATERVTVAGSGNVGAASPDQALHVQGNIQVGDDTVANPWFLTFYSTPRDSWSGAREEPPLSRTRTAVCGAWQDAGKMPSKMPALPGEPAHGTGRLLSL